ncbi:helix-turn-helix domain-containing protein [Vibrio splendidus]|uniref:Helix-turn-helix domain-containing protein n=1 Tax=Vibrio splendidus TaxID=29497 RepID=A0AA43G0E9_VIBSP|nr:helix-turn-helix transcriptional regulator [Vibrio splendidus]MDH5922809.1 helix-turn-helix domain-containing protein [Vibrio splendidus]
MEYNPIPTRLKQARKRAGITQKNLGVMIGMDESSASGRMNHYEKGRHTPDISTLKKMADALGVPLNYFLCEDESSAELSIQISRLTESEKKEALELIRRIANNKS